MLSGQTNVVGPTVANTNPTRTETIASILRDDILRGQYRPGERLPSERDLATRHATSRGTVREALKKLEQLGLADIRPGGARAAAVQECSLEVLGPLLDLDPTPDAKLVDEVLELGGILMRFAAEAAARKGDDASLGDLREVLAEIRRGSGQAEVSEPIARLLRLLAEASDHLVLRLIMNGLREQVREHLCLVCTPQAIQPGDLQRIARKLETALDRRLPSDAGVAIQELFELLRHRAADRQRSAEPARRAAS